MPEKVAFLCLGTMGYPMAGHLSRARHAITVYNRTRSRADAWVAEHGGRAAVSPAEAASQADVVLVCTGNDDDLREVVLGEQGAFAGAAPGSLLVDHTTVSAGLARELAEKGRALGVDTLDAPVSGGESGAREGRLTIMAGGEQKAFERARPLLEHYGRAVTWMGPPGSGQLTKMVNQTCIAGLIQALAEGIHFARTAGLDPHRVIDVISKGAAQSWQMENRAGTMIEGEYGFGFAVDWMRKDLGLSLAEARRNGARLPVTALVDQLYAELQSRGAGRLDTSSLLRLLEADAR